MFFKAVDINPLFIAIIIAALIFSSQQIKICYTWLNRRKTVQTIDVEPYHQ